MQKYRSPAIELYGSHGVLQMLGDDWAPEGYELWRDDEQAWARARISEGDKGGGAARAALTMIELKHQLSGGKR